MSVSLASSLHFPELRTIARLSPRLAARRGHFGFPVLCAKDQRGFCRGAGASGRTGACPTDHWAAAV